METQPPEKTDTILDSIVKEFARRGLLLFVVLFLFEIALFFVVAVLPFFPGEQTLYTNQSNQISTQFQGVSWFSLFWGIFTNNLRIALIEMIPGLGPILFAFSLYATVRVLQVIAISDNASAVVLVILLLLLFPHSWIELPAYAIATGESIYLSYGIYKALRGRGRGPKFDQFTGVPLASKGYRFRSEIGQLVINLVIVSVMLMVAVFFESTEIELGAFLFWVTWIPFAALIVVCVFLNRRLRRLRKSEVPQPIYPMVIQ